MNSKKVKHTLRKTHTKKHVVPRYKRPLQVNPDQPASQSFLSFQLLWGKRPCTKAGHVNLHSVARVLACTHAPPVRLQADACGGGLADDGHQLAAAHEVLLLTQVHHLGSILLTAGLQVQWVAEGITMSFTCVEAWPDPR
eukprot:scaffold30289_cov19-Tisochrysis_lutea.AAC.4